jgi:8-oxo-dGTP pyrophosphatase MutT (NUDIX family)
MIRPKNVVSTKLALYSHDLSSVLVMRYPIRGLNGLPGGHVEVRENPDETIRRELVEELSLSVTELKRADFFLREGDRGPIILAYTAIAPENISIKPTNPKFEYAKWVTKDDIGAVVMSPEYTRFVLENWPNA